MKKNSAVLGKAGDKDISIDLPTLIATRMLIQGRSNSGKSHAARRILEQTFSAIPQIIIDSEGEFVTLREKFDYIICAPSGADVVATPDTAKKLAHELLRHRVSAIIDISEMDIEERLLFVERFCRALVMAPKKLWGATIFLLDEAHSFCSQGEKGLAACTHAVSNLVAKGRKRGICTILATQRLAKLKKDAAAELQNVLTGGVTLDLDLRRAADLLGMTYKDAAKALRPLKQGEFYIFGPAISDTMEKIKVGPVVTKHVGLKYVHDIKASKPSKKVLKVLAKLDSLPQEAEEEAATIADLETKVKRLERDLSRAEKSGAVKEVVREVEKVVKVAPSKKEIEAAIAKEIGAVAKEVEKIFNDFSAAIDTGADILIKGVKEMSGHRYRKEVSQRVVATVAETKLLPGAPATFRKDNTKYNILPPPPTGDGNLPGGPLKMLKALAGYHPNSYTRNQFGALSGYSASGGTFGKYLGILKRGGFVAEKGTGKNAFFTATPKAIDYLGGDIPEPKSHNEIMEMWGKALGGGPFKMLGFIVRAASSGIERNALGAVSEYAASGGTFGKYLGILRKNGLIEEKQKGIYTANDILWGGAN